MARPAEEKRQPPSEMNPSDMAALVAAKRALRKQIKLRIAKLTDEEKQRQSDIVVKKVLQHERYQACQSISVFLSMHDEIRTEGLLHHIFSSEKRCYIPQYIGDTMHMLRLQSWEDFQALPETSWKIKQPLEGDLRENALESGGLDLIIMPGLAFSEQGARLGRGKGFYDTYIEKCERLQGKRPYLLAVAFNEQLVEDVPMSDHDCLMDQVICAEQQS